MLQGDTRNLPLANIFQTLAINQQDGVLTIRHGSSERCIAIENSQISVLCERPLESVLLPQILERLDVLNCEEYQNVFATASEAKSPGDTLLERHLLTSDLINYPIREFLLERLFEVFQWPAARYRFEVKAVNSQQRIFASEEYQNSHSIPINNLLMEIARREDEWNRIHSTLANSKQIFIVDGDEELIQTIESFEGMNPERAQSFVELFQGELTLSECIEKSSTPDFYNYRCCIELLNSQNLRAMETSEKERLAETLRNNFQMDRVATIYGSILVDSPQNEDVRKKLLLHLEKKGPPESLNEHYRVLAQLAGQRDDTSLQTHYLEKLLIQLPNDVEALADKAEISYNARLKKEFSSNWRKFINAVYDGRLYEIGLDRALQLFEQTGQPEELQLDLGKLYLATGDRSAAHSLFEKVAACHLEAKRFTELRAVIDHMNKSDPGAAAGWLKHLETIDQQAGSKKTAKNSHRMLIYICLIVTIVGGYSTYEWKARITYAAMLNTANGEDEAMLLEKFREDYPISITGWLAQASNSATIIIPAEGQAEESSVNTVSPGLEPATQKSNEELLTEAASALKFGKYDEAFQSYAHVDSSQLSDTAKKVVVRERLRLKSYLENAAHLLSTAKAAEERREFPQAFDSYQQLYELYPNSKASRDSSAPVRIIYTPRTAVLTAGGKAIEGDIVRGRFGFDRSISIGHTDFESKIIAIDPLRDGSTVEIHLNRSESFGLRVANTIDSAPLIVDETLFFGPRDGKLYAYSLTTGQLKWKFDIPKLADVLGPIVRTGSGVLLRCSDSSLSEVSLSGELIGRVATPNHTGSLKSTARAVDSYSRLFVVTTRGYALAIDLNSHSILWEQSLRSRVLLAPCFGGGLAFICSADGLLTALDAQTGEQRWQKQLGSTPLTPPVAFAGKVFIALSNSKLIALEASSGNERWVLNKCPPATGHLETGSGLILGATVSGELFCVEAKNGQIKWSKKLNGEIETGPTLNSQLVFAPLTTGGFSTHHLQDGRLIWRQSTGTAPSLTIAAKDSHILQALSDGTIRAFKIEQEELLK